MCTTKLLRLVSALSLAVTLAACATDQTQVVADAPDGSRTVINFVQRVNPVAQDLSVITVQHCGKPPFERCSLVSVDNSTERGFAGAVFEGTGPAAALALGGAIGLSNLRPARTNIQQSGSITGGNTSSAAEARSASSSNSSVTSGSDPTLSAGSGGGSGASSGVQVYQP